MAVVLICTNRSLDRELQGTVLFRSDIVRETVRTTHHDAPRYIYAHAEMPIKMIEPAPLINHTDAELIMLEALVGRRPPFFGSATHYF